MNPRAATNDLLPFQGSPFGQLGYFSKSPYLLSKFFIKLFLLSCDSLFSITDVPLFVKHFLNLFFKVFNKRREWDSNPRALADKRFSRPPRYDHFDTPARERVMGIEPTYPAWKAGVLPLNYTRM